MTHVLITYQMIFSYINTCWSSGLHRTLSHCIQSYLLSGQFSQKKIPKTLQEFGSSVYPCQTSPQRASLHGHLLGLGYLETGRLLWNRTHSSTSSQTKWTTPCGHSDGRRQEQSFPQQGGWVPWLPAAVQTEIPCNSVGCGAKLRHWASH